MQGGSVVMARTKREMAARLFEAGLFGVPIYATLCVNKHQISSDQKYRYVEIYTYKDVPTPSGMFRSSKAQTIFRFFVTLEEWENKIFIPNNGLTAGQAMRLIEQFWDKRVAGPNCWGKKDI
jgi:hypothetical protein